MRLDHLLSKESLSGPFGPDTPSRSLAIRCHPYPAPGGPHIFGCPVREACGLCGWQWASLFRFEGVTLGSCPLGSPGRFRPSDATPARPVGRVAGRSPVRSAPRHRSVRWCRVPRMRRCAPLENSIASTSIYVLQVIKSQRRMPWRLKPKKDVGGCDKPRGAAYQAWIRGCPNGETRHPSWGVTLV